MNRSNPGNQEITLFAAAFIAFLCVLFGANTVAIKISFNGVGSFTAAGIRFSSAAVFISIWARVTGRSFRFKRAQWLHIILLSILFNIQLSLFYLGLSKTYASRGALIANLLPFFVLFLSHVFIPDDRITIRKFFGILLGFTGVAFLFINHGEMTGELYTGDLIIFTAVIIWAGNAVYTKKIIKDFLPFQLVLYPMIFTGPLFFIEGWIWDHEMVWKMDLKITGALIYQSLVTASFGFVAWNTLLKKYGATAIHSFVFIMPISGVFFGWYLLGEPIDSKIITALVMITTGILVVHLKVKRLIPSFPLGRGL